VTRPVPSRALRYFLTAVALLFSVATQAQSSSGADADAGQARILLVLPFDNLTGPVASPVAPAMPAASGQSATPETAAPDPASLDWIREAVPDILTSRFTSAGFLPLTREDRLYALDHLGLPETFQPSRATALKIAEILDANYILIGSYRVESGKLTLKSRIVDVAKLRISDEVTETGPIDQLIPLLNSLAWQLTRKLDPSFSVAQETFRAASANLRLDAFEQYIRGETEPDPAERLRHLKKATDLSPDFTEAWLATAKIEFASQQYEQAAVSFSKVTRIASSPDPSALEAGFYRGLALMYSGNYPRAEEAFAAVARVMPLPEVVNNQAVAMSRRGKDAAGAIPLFRQAAAADPKDADYHFNLAVSLHRHGDNAEALTELAESLKLRPNDSEAKSTLDLWKSSSASPLDSTDGEPLERIKRSYDGAAFRQAALMVDQVESARLAALPGPERAAKLASSAHEKLDRGLLLDAERGFQAALAADSRSAEAHAGLAEVRERSGDLDAARNEALAALAIKPNLDAYLVLARLDLAANHLTEARDEAESALKLEPASRNAKDLRKTIESRLEAKSTPVTPTKP
jgi:tetratricopeptide (TPR) repeat protein